MEPFFPRLSEKEIIDLTNLTKPTTSTLKQYLRAGYKELDRLLGMYKALLCF